MTNYTIKGKIANVKNTPLSNLTVCAYDVDLRRRELLGETTTDRKGAYQITYTADQFVRATKTTADVLIEVFDAEKRLIGQSDIHFNAGSDITIDVVIAPEKYKPLAEFDDISATLSPILERSGIGLSEVEVDDITFMAGETGLDKTKLIYFVLAQRLSEPSGLDGTFWYAALFYKVVLMSNIDTGQALETAPILASMPAMNVETVRHALEKGVKNNRIAATFDVEHALVQFKKQAVEQAHRLETVVKNILTIAQVAEHKHEDFASLFVENRAFDADFKQKIQRDKRFTQKEKTNLATAFRLAELTDNNVTLMQRLKTAVGVKGENGLRQLARKSSTEWASLIADTVGERNLLDNDTTTNINILGAMPKTTAHIAARFAATYPTAAFTGALSRHVAATKRKDTRQASKTRALLAEKPNVETVNTPLPTVSGSAISILPDILGFLNQNSDFDLLEHNIDTYFEQNAPQKTSQTRALLAQEDTTELKNSLKTVQRVFRLQPNFEATKSLLAKDIHSSQKIYNMGEQAFVQEIKDAAGFTERTARATFHKAANTHAAVLTMVADWRDAHEAQSIAALQTPSSAPTPPAERGLLPNMETLFGSADVCECEQCRSVFSPSAYLMDTITFLKNRQSTTLGKSAWDVLKQRRPDIGFLEMSCENTNVPLPYIDIVCEVLEEEAALVNTDLQDTDAAWAFVLPLSIEGDLRQGLGLASDALKAAFKDQNILLTDSAVISEKKVITDRSTYDCWFVRDTPLSFKIVKRPTDLAVALLRQTRNTEAELAATPQYINDKVYERGLSKAIYPFSMPFNLFFEETKAFMQQAQIEQTDLIDTIVGNSVADNTALTYFQFPKIILDTPLDEQYKFWGVHDRMILTMWFMNVNPFLKVTGLEYTDLLRLLDTKWINGDGKYFIRHNDTSCNTQSKQIVNTDDAFFERVYKFLRLTRATGWEMGEIDLVLRHPKIGNGVFDQQFLTQLRDFSEIKITLGLSVEQTLVLLGDINTETYFSEAYAARINGLYQTIFLNPRNMPPTAFAIEQVTAANPTALIADNKKALQTALQLREADLDVLLNLKQPDGTPFLAADAPVSLTNLSFLYRNVLLYRALDIPSMATWAAFIQFMDVIALDTLTNWWLSRDNVEMVKQASTFFKAGYFDISELGYIGKNNRTTKVAPKEADIATFLTTLLTIVRTMTENDARVFVIQQLSEKLGLSLPLTDYALTNLWFGTVKGDAILPFLDKNQALPITSVNFSNGFDSYHWLQRVTLLIQKFGMNLKEVQTLNDLQTQDTLMAKLHFAPLSETITIKTFSELKTALDFNRLYATEKLNFWDIQTQLQANAYADIPTFAADMAVLFKVKATDIAFLITEWNGESPFPTAYAWNSKTWQRLEKALNFSQKLNISAAELKTLANTNGSYRDQTDLLKQALRPFYAEKQWLDLVKTIQDDLRERKRTALVSYLLTQTGHFLPPPSGKWENANDLYAYYLMDVEMTSAQPTSRIVQAAGSIQLFVQRCLMGLEPEIVVDTEGVGSDTGWLQWQWMKNYRVWEANRKVFLFPENWIEPELRRNKSPFFKELENELAQNELNKDTVETVFLNYLEKLQSVAQLEPMGHCWQEETDTFHVFARTQGKPPAYYYRQFIDGRRWTAWTKLDLDIPSDHLVPFVRNGRLYLFWGEVSVAIIDNNPTIDIPQLGGTFTPTPPKKELRLSLGYSQLNNGKWTPKKISQDSIEIGETDKSIIPTNGFLLVPLDSDDIQRYVKPNSSAFIIDCYSKGENINFKDTNHFFMIDGCKGIPEVKHIDRGNDDITKLSSFADTRYENMKAIEGHRHNIDALIALDSDKTPRVILEKTGTGDFTIYETWQPSFIDEYHRSIRPLDLNKKRLFVGNNMPYFFSDFQRTFWVQQKFVNSDNGKVFTHSNILILMRLLFPLDEQYRQLEEDLKSGKITKATFDTEKNDLFKRYEKILLVDHASLFKAMQTPRAFFYTFYHPFVCLFASRIYNEGIPGLMKRSTQRANKDFDFKATYEPTDNTGRPYPREDVDFTPDGSYSLYNWELFFHAPLMIALRFAKNQQFEEAFKWFHYIFNPLGPSSVDGSNPAPASKYWITKPFFERQHKEYDFQRIDILLKKLAGDPSVPADDTALNPPFTRQEIENQVSDWRTHPFEPHTIAEYRTVAYQKTVIMKYLDTLIAWGDQLYRRDTMESVNEATQMYIMAAEILGARPRRVPPQYKAQPETFHELEAKMDEFSNSLVTGLENLVPAVPSTPTPNAASLLPNVLYFCLPQNDKLLNYWDTVANRLYNIRHGLNIEGVKRSLALFAPAIDPAALVRAVAGGADIGSALADMAAPLPIYRFSVALQKANELCNDVKGLGGALLSALEKKDGEALGLLRQTHEIAVLQSVRSIKMMQIEDAKLALEGLKKSKQLIDIRRDYTMGLQEEGLNTGEHVALDLNIASTVLDAGVAIGYALAGGLKFIPKFIAGVSGLGSPVATIQTPEFGEATENAVKTVSAISHALDKGANIANTLASYARRREEWTQQIKLANKELEQMEKSIASAELKIRLGEQELKNHDLQVANAHAVEDYMKSKYTNRELYEWQIGQIAQIYFQTYQLAYDWAKKAEKCWRFELGIPETTPSVIQFGHWDSLHKGLMSGEKLQLDLRRLEAAYMETNKREFELTKHISLALINPMAVLQLREKGTCQFDLPEEIFDLDYQGHYFRRIKTVSLSIPCIAGPYTTINGTLRLMKNSVRFTNRTTPQYASSVDGDDRFMENPVGIKTVAMSSAQNDNGMFDFNFRDERYLPFEGAGVVSTWVLELTPERSLRQFDYNSISDAILHIRYTAREDGALRTAATTYLKTLIDNNVANNMPLKRLFSLRHEFPTAWHRFLQPEAEQENICTLDMIQDRFPFFAQGKKMVIKSAEIHIKASNLDVFELQFIPPLMAPINLTSAIATATTGLQAVTINDSLTLSNNQNPASFWQFKLRKRGVPNFNSLIGKDIEDLFLLVDYTLQ